MKKYSIVGNPDILEKIMCFFDEIDIKYESFEDCDTMIFAELSSKNLRNLTDDYKDIYIGLVL